MSPKNTKLWIDGDGIPKKIKEILFRAAQKRRVPIIFVSNRWQELPRFPTIQQVVVSDGLDKADDHIAENCELGDLIITSDIPLADRCVTKGAKVLTSRGRELTVENIKPALSARNLSEDLRNYGVQTGGPPAISQRDIQNFSNALDRWIQKR